MRHILFLAMLMAGIALSVPASSQGLLKKLKEKAAKTVEEKLEKKAGTSTENTDANNNPNAANNNTNTAGKPANKGGGGLTNTEPPDVAAQIVEAETAHNAKNYSDARYSLQQALMGIEIQLGRQILKSLPLTAAQAPADTVQDKVMSTQWGWNNLTIQRVYRMNDKQLTVTIGNNGAYSGLVTAYFANAGMVQATGSSQNLKQVRVKGNKALIQYDDNKGYTLIVQLGQSSMVVWECINFANEQEVMSTANDFDIDSIRKMLGEQ